MAKPDGDHYETVKLTDYHDEDRTDDVVMIISGTAGSGTCTTTFLASDDGDYTHAADITQKLLEGESSWVVSSGTDYLTITDNLGVLRGAKYLHVKFVLATAAADDADYTLTTDRFRGV